MKTPEQKTYVANAVAKHPSKRTAEEKAAILQSMTEWEREATMKTTQHTPEELLGAYRHMEACRTLLNVPTDEVLYARIEKLRDSHKELWSALHELDMAHSHQTLCRAKERARAAMAHAASVCGKRDDLQEELV